MRAIIYTDVDAATPIIDVLVAEDAVNALLVAGARVVTLTHHVVWNCYEHEDHEENCYPETEWWQTDPQEVDLDEWEGVQE